jgi:Ni,Fe-hydrogenase I cytochrome b subunit
MVNYLESGLPVFVFVVLTVAIIFGGLVFYALRNKGDVFAELSIGKTAFRFDAKDKRNTRRLR